MTYHYLIRLLGHYPACITNKHMKSCIKYDSFRRVHTKMTNIWPLLLIITKNCLVIYAPVIETFLKQL